MMIYPGYSKFFMSCIMCNTHDPYMDQVVQRENRNRESWTRFINSRFPNWSEKDELNLLLIAYTF